MQHSWDAECKLLMNFLKFEAFEKSFMGKIVEGVLIHRTQQIPFYFIMLHSEPDYCRSRLPQLELLEEYMNSYTS